MNRQKWIAIGLCAIMSLSVSLTPRAARADELSDQRPVRLVATDWADPIGKVSSEFLAKGALTINGRSACADQLVWDRDLLHARGNTTIPVVLDSMGTILLRRGAVVRLTTRRGEGEEKRDEMIASLAQGEVSIKLQPKTRARVHAGGSAFVSSPGAVFVARFREGLSSFAVKSGEVHKEKAQAGQQHQYTIKPVGHDSNIRVPASGTVQIQVQVMEDSLPVPGVGVLFVLDLSGAISGQLGVGTLSNTTLNVVTNANGIAAVQFVAGPSSGIVPVSATIEGTRTSWTGEIAVTSRGGGSHKLGWVIGVLLGTGAAAGIAYALTRRDRDPLEVQPPEIKNP
ncbi:MAG: hypothetical protein WAU45_23780 [Blastocatellia bacterium]